MHIEINTDKHIESSEALTHQVRTTVEKTLDRFAERLTRVEVHLSDENAEKGGTDDHVCTMEARPRGMPPLAATHKADSVKHAVDGAAQRLANKLRTRFGRLDDRQGEAKLPHEEEQG